MKRKTTEEFILQATKFHGDRYDYSKTNYTTQYKTVKIICKLHGEFEQYPNNHLQGKNCIECSIIERSNKRKSNKDEFIIKSIEIHGIKYNYDFVEYNNSKTKVKILCQKHGEFLQTPDNHLSGQGCPDCGSIIAGIKSRIDKDKIIQRAKLIHGDRYEYIDMYYKENYDYILKINCSKHGIFEQTARHHSILGCNCPKCVIEENRREGNARWNGGFTPFKIALRNLALSEWKKESMRSCGYKCVITGLEFKDIHHLYSFDLIFNEIFENLNIEIRPTLVEYTEEEINLIVEECKKLHNKYGLGVCINRKDHIKFHCVYGFGNNTKEQFEEFKQIQIQQII